MSRLADELVDGIGAGNDAKRYLLTALQHMADASPGYPSGHTGGPSGPDSDVHLTQPERFEMLRDDAIADYQRLVTRVRDGREAMVDVWGIVTKWGVVRDAADLEVADPEDEMWCRSCLRIRHFAPRRQSGGVNCDWCATTLRTLNETRASKAKRALTELPLQAVRAHAEGRRVYQRDLERWAGITDIRSDRASKRKRKVNP